MAPTVVFTHSAGVSAHLRNSARIDDAALHTMRSFLRARVAGRLAFAATNSEGLTEQAVELLVLLASEGPRSATEAAERLAMNRSTVAHAARLILDLGYVDRAEQRRGHHV